MKRILIIEDEELLLNLLQNKLSQEDYYIEIAKDGQDGIAKARENKPDLILLDIIMPKMGGFEVMEEISRDKNLKGVPIVIISNSGQPVELDRAKELGAIDWLIKTNFSPEEVAEKVRKNLK